MRPRILVAAGICVLVAIGIWPRTNRRPSNEPAQVGTITGILPSRSPAASYLVPSTPAIPAANQPFASTIPTRPVPDTTAMIDLDKVNLMLRDYRTLMGENPIGTNAEIMKAIMGNNPKKAVLGPPEGLSLNDHGELTDQWGTPLFFHQLSKTHMEIWSAGPDRKMGTSDDVTLK